jgi:hypothetical protein
MLAGLTVALPACAQETGIRGTVVRGPVKPGPSRMGDETDEAPLSATFTVHRNDREVTRFRSAADGSFTVSLPPGDYTIVPEKDTPVPYATRQTTQVTVPEGAFADITIRLDTGMK